MIPDRSSPSRVSFAAPRPGPLRADLKGMAVYERKGWMGLVVGLLRAVVERRRRGAPLTRPLTKAISGVLFSGFIPSRDGFDFGFLIRRLIHRATRSYYL